MTFDTQEQKDLLTQIVGAAQITTSVSELEKVTKKMTELLKAVAAGEVKEVSHP